MPYPGSRRREFQDTTRVRREQTTLEHGFATVVLPRKLTDADLQKLKRWLASLLEEARGDLTEPVVIRTLSHGYEVSDVKVTYCDRPPPAEDPPTTTPPTSPTTTPLTPEIPTTIPLQETPRDHWSDVVAELAKEVLPNVTEQPQQEPSDLPPPKFAQPNAHVPLASQPRPQLPRKSPRKK